MRLREFLIDTALMSIALITAKASPSPVFHDDLKPGFGDERQNATDASVTVLLPPAPSPLISQDKVLGSAYYNTLKILSTNDRCSDFFGGPAVSVDVFNKLIGAKAIPVGADRKAHVRFHDQHDQCPDKQRIQA